MTPPGENRHFRPPPPPNFAPPHRLSTASLTSVRIASLFSLFSFAIFLRLDQTNFSRFRRTLSTGFDCWLCYFRYLRPKLTLKHPQEMPEISVQLGAWIRPPHPTT